MSDGSYENLREFPSDGDLRIGELQRTPDCSGCAPHELIRGVAMARRFGPSADSLAPGTLCAAEITCHGRRSLTAGEAADHMASSLPLPAGVCDISLNIVVDPMV